MGDSFVAPTHSAVAIQNGAGNGTVIPAPAKPTQWHTIITAIVTCKPGGTLGAQEVQLSFGGEYLRFWVSPGGPFVLPVANWPLQLGASVGWETFQAGTDQIEISILYATNG